MKLSYVLVAIILLVAGVYFVSQRSGAMEITQTGDDLSIAIGHHRLQATKTSGGYSDSFLVIGGMQHGDLHFTTLLSVIPLETAEYLAETYGNFRRCGSPGAAEGMRSVEPMVLYAAHPGVERTLKKINKLALAGKDPVIAMDFACLEITNHSIEKKGHSIDVTSMVNMDPPYLVTDVQLVRQGMEF